MGMKTVPVLSVAKEVAARCMPALCAGRGAPNPNTGRAIEADWLIDNRVQTKKVLSFVHLLMFPSLLEVIIGRELPIECSKLTCSAKVKNRHGTQAVRSTIEVGCCQSSCVDCEAEFDLGRGKIGRRRRIHTEKTKTTTIIDTRIRIHTSLSRSEVDVRWPATDRRCMRLDPVYVALPTSLS